MKRLNRLIAGLRSRAAGEEGFTLVEVMMAVAILAIALLALARTATVAFTDVAAARQRQTANQLANQLVEQVRALPYESVKRGLKTSQLTGDPNVEPCLGTYYFPKMGCPAPAGSEEVVHSNAVGSTRPLKPHTGTVGPPDYPATYSWSVYVTEAADAPSAGAYRVTARVSWTPAQRTGVRNSVDAKTLLYSPTGSVDSSTHPFTGPRQAFFYATANAGAGAISTVGRVGGVAFDVMSADLMQTTSTVQTEQTLRVEGATALPGLTKSVAGVEITSSGASDSSQADTDPSTTAGTSDRKPNIGPQVFSSQSVGSSSTSLLSWTDGFDLGETASATAASASQPCTTQIDGFPCGFGSGTMADAPGAPGAGEEAPYGADFDTSMFVVTDTLGVAELLRVGSSPTPTTAYVRRTGAGGAGVARGNISWTLPEIRLGGVPSGMNPPHSNWEGYWVKLTGFTATAQAEAGPGAATPTITVAGTIRYWKGNSYSNEPVTTNGKSLSMNEVRYGQSNVGVNREKVDVLIDGTVKVEKSSTIRAVNAGVTTEATGTVASPLVAEFRYLILRNDLTAVDLTVSFSAGRARVGTSYKPGP